MKIINQDKKQNSLKLLMAVLASMVLIVAIWATYFFPKNSKQENNYSFKAFKENIANAFGIFKNTNNLTQDDKDQADINDLRVRVFGDKIER